MQYLARPEANPYCTAQPLLVSLPPFEEWALPTLVPPPPPQDGCAASDGGALPLEKHALAEHALAEHALAGHALAGHALAEHALAEHAPRLSEDFWRKHAPVEHCALRTPHSQIQL